MIPHMLVLDMPREKELLLYLRQKLKESGYTQGSAGLAIGRSQSWFPNRLFSVPVTAIRSMYTNEPDLFAKLVKVLNLEEATVLRLAGIIVPTAGGVMAPIDSVVPVYAASTGPKFDEIEAVGYAPMPTEATTGDVIGLRVSGMTMCPYLDDGETAYVEMNSGAIEPGTAIGLHLPGVGSVVRNFVQMMPDGGIVLESLNPTKGEPRVFVAHEFTVYGPVVSRLKKR